MRRPLSLSTGLLRLVCALAVVWTAWAVAPSLADDASLPARISNLKLRLDGSQVLVSFKLENAFDETLRKRIDSGIPTGFDYSFQLERDRKTWFDTDVDRGRLRVDAMYNAVTREYLINIRRDGDLIESKVVRDPDALRKALTEFDSLPVFKVEGKATEQRLRVRLRAELGTQQIFFFIPKKLTTSWVETRRFQISSED